MTESNHRKAPQWVLQISSREADWLRDHGGASSLDYLLQLHGQYKLAQPPEGSTNYELRSLEELKKLRTQLEVRLGRIESAVTKKATDEP